LLLLFGDLLLSEPVVLVDLLAAHRVDLVDGKFLSRQT
jgi:hypothetical protein